MKRIPPSERIRKKQEEILQKGLKGEKLLSTFLQNSDIFFLFSICILFILIPDIFYIFNKKG